MGEFIKKHKTVFMRIIGIILLIAAVLISIFEKNQTPSDVDIAAANVARMESSVQSATVISSSQGGGSSVFMRAYNKTRQKHMRYLLFFLIVSAVGLLIYSFIKKEE